MSKKLKTFKLISLHCFQMEVLIIYCQLHRPSLLITTGRAFCRLGQSTYGAQALRICAQETHGMVVQELETHQTTSIQ